MNGIRLFFITGIIILAALAQVAVATPKTLGYACAAEHRAAEQSAETQPSKLAEKKSEDCGCEAKTPPDVLATVGGVKILIKDVDESINDRIKELQSQV